MLRRAAWLLGLAGALIFAGLAAALLSPETRIRIPSIAALVTFSALVISWLGGVESGLALREGHADDWTRTLAFAAGAIPPLAAWGVLLVLPSTQWQLGAAIALFIAIWMADLWLARRGLIPSWFVDIRTAATLIACAVLGVALYLL